MPKAGIQFADAAFVDLEALRSWYAEQDIPEIGARLLREIIDSIEVLAEHPETGRIVPAFEQPLLRELIRPPLRIAYRRDPKHVRNRAGMAQRAPARTAGRTCALSAADARIITL